MIKIVCGVGSAHMLVTIRLACLIWLFGSMVNQLIFLTPPETEF